MYDYRTSSFEDGNLYRDHVNLCVENNMLDGPMMQHLQGAVERYINCIVENIYEADIGKVANRFDDEVKNNPRLTNNDGQIKHNTQNIYSRLLYPKDKKEIAFQERHANQKSLKLFKELFPFNIEIKRSLYDCYRHAQDTRYKRDPLVCFRQDEVTQELMLQDVEFMDNMQMMAEAFLIKNQQLNQDNIVNDSPFANIQKIYDDAISGR